ncbi:hypothetical protein ACJX0J_010130, partial [Zea mays]
AWVQKEGDKREDRLKSVARPLLLSSQGEKKTAMRMYSHTHFMRFYQPILIAQHRSNNFLYNLLHRFVFMNLNTKAYIFRLNFRLDQCMFG